MPISRSHDYAIVAEILDVGAPLLFDLEAFLEMQDVPDLDKDQITGNSDSSAISHVHKRDHVFVEWPMELDFTNLELQHMHRHFKSPSAKRASTICCLAKAPFSMTENV